VEEDGHSYFGPFWGVLARRIMRMITRHFMIRTCTIEIDGKLPRPCLYYDLHACLGPCVAGLTTKEAYDEAVRDVVLFLQGRNRELVRRLEDKMRRVADEENFEMAAAYRDAIRTIGDVAEHQLVQSMKGESVDVVGFFESGGDVSVCLLVVRAGGLRPAQPFESQEAIQSFQARFPSSTTATPFFPPIHLPVAIETRTDPGFLSSAPRRRWSSTPKRGTAAGASSSPATTPSSGTSEISPGWCPDALAVERLARSDLPRLRAGSKNFDICTSREPTASLTGCRDGRP
jgi:excinuclease ABC subunit C